LSRQQERSAVPPKPAPKPSQVALKAKPPAGDGLDNKERWHWRERDLKDWVNDWLKHAFVRHNDGLLFDDSDARVRVTTIRGDYDNGGEVFLSWRKGRCFATYEFGIRLEYQGVLLLGEGGRAIGQGKGVVRMFEIAHGQDKCPEDWPMVFEGAWEKPPPGQPAEAVREPMEYELQLKQLVEERATAVIRGKIEVLRSALAKVAEADGKVPDAVDSAAEHMRERDVQAADGQEPVPSSASEAAAEFVEGLRKKARSQRLLEALEKPDLEDISLFMCDVRAADMPELVAALGKNEVLRTLDLRDNAALDDGALQPLLIGLANGLAPTLTTLRLGGTKASTITKNMAKGLGIMRKQLEISFDASLLREDKPGSSSAALSSAPVTVAGSSSR